MTPPPFIAVQLYETQYGYVQPIEPCLDAATIHAEWTATRTCGLWAITIMIRKPLVLLVSDARSFHRVLLSSRHKRQDSVRRCNFLSCAGLTSSEWLFRSWERPLFAVAQAILLSFFTTIRGIYDAYMV
jgi:hypothetical protein